MKMLQYGLWLLVSILFVQTATAMPVTGKRIARLKPFDQKVIKLLNAWKIPGAAIVVYRRGRPYYARGFGWADVAARRKVQPDSLFRIASVSKTVTATAILKLAFEHKLDLDASIYPLLDLRPLPGQKIAPNIDKITIADCLHMASGWGRWFDPMFGPWPKSYLKRLRSSLPPRCITAARFMMSQNLAYRPGRVYQYANINYCLLGLVVEKVTGIPYSQYVRSQIMAPLGIHNMRLANTKLGSQAKGEVHYYPTYPKPKPTQSDLVSIPGLPYGNNQLLYKNFANGGWVASAIDLAKWVNAVQNGKLFSQRYVKMMTAPPPSHRNDRPTARSRARHTLPWPYGMGWILLVHKGQLVWYTHGSFTGTNAMILRLKNGTIFVALFNKKPTPYANLTRLRNQMKKLFFRYFMSA